MPITPLRVAPCIFGARVKASPSARWLFRPVPIHKHSTRTMSGHLEPYTHDSGSSKWRRIQPSDTPNKSEQGQNLTIVSWNVDFSKPSPASRVAALIGYLQDVYGKVERQLVIFLQEVCDESLHQILRTSWIAKTFNITGLPPPAGYFTLILTPRNFTIKNCWRLGFPSRMGRDALFVDIARAAFGGDAGNQECIRLCTTHLESLGDGLQLRKKQLQLISQHLKDKEVACGVVGGDFNAIEHHENLIPAEVGLTDAWTENSEALKDGDTQMADLNGRREGFTWGYQSPGTPWPPRRFDKFLYTGRVELVPSNESDGQMERVRRLGIDLKTATNIEGGSRAYANTKGVWVSDHFGIAIEVKIT